MSVEDQIGDKGQFAHRAVSAGGMGKDKQFGPAGGEMVGPEAVLAAAERAPRVFEIAAYFDAIRIMRDKGHSWRAVAAWLKDFNIEVSYVHLRRLFIQEQARRPARAGGDRDGAAAADADEAKWTRL